MEVSDHQQGGWYLLRDGARYYLTANVHQPMVDTSILIELDEDEKTELILGHVYADYLAARINYWSEQYRERNITGPLADEVHQTIMRWLEI